jgi:hypothetical protein
MIAIEKLISALRELSDEAFQWKAWLAPTGPVVSSPSEQISQTFDDTGLADALDAGKRPAGISKEAFSTLQALDVVVQNIDQSLPPEILLEDSAVIRARALARKALTLLGMT